MAVRNLTTHFVRARAAAQNSRPTRFDNFSDSETGPVMPKGAAAAPEARVLIGGPIPTYVTDVDEINNAVDFIQRQSAWAGGSGVPCPAL